MGTRFASITLQQGPKDLIKNKAFLIRDTETFQKVFNDKSAGFVADGEFVVDLKVGICHMLAHVASVPLHTLSSRFLSL
jgi:hypothetical protein